jgi:hypothetical protein
MPGRGEDEMSRGRSDLREDSQDASRPPVACTAQYGQSSPASNPSNPSNPRAQDPGPKPVVCSLLWLTMVVVVKARRRRLGGLK